MAVHFEGLRALLLADDDINAALGTNPKSSDKCVRPDRLRESDRLPAIEIETKSSGQELRLALDGDADSQAARTIFRVVASSRSGSDALAETVRQYLDSIDESATTGGTVEGVDVLGISYQFFPLADGSDGGEYTSDIECVVWSRSG